MASARDAEEAGEVAGSAGEAAEDDEGGKVTSATGKIAEADDDGNAGAAAGREEDDKEEGEQGDTADAAEGSTADNAVEAASSLLFMMSFSDQCLNRHLLPYEHQPLKKYFLQQLSGTADAGREGRAHLWLPEEAAGECCEEDAEMVRVPNELARADE